MKNKQQAHSDDEGAPSENDMVVNMSNTSSQIVVKRQLDNKPQKKMGGAGPPNSTQQMPQRPKKGQEDSSSLIMTESVVRAGGAPEIYTYTQESFDEAREAKQNGFISNLLQPLENIQREKNPKSITDEVIETLSKKLSIDQKDSSVPTNPHWVMQKQVRMLPLLDHYLRPTYYDVIYLQPQLDIHSRRSKQAKSGTSSGGVHFASKLANSSTQQKNELGPRLETHFNFDVLSIVGGGRRAAK